MLHTESATANGTLRPLPAFLQGDGELRTITRAVDWSATSLGTPDTWPHSLRTTLGILLHSAFPMFLFWGPELLCFYNDAYRPSLGADGKHPCVGRPGREVWPETWDTIGPQIEQVLRSGASTFHENQLIPIYRNGRLEDVYWTYSYSPVFDEAGRAAGVFVTCAETTGAVVHARGLKESEQRFRALVTTTTDVVYRMSADWSEMWELDGKDFLSSTKEPTRNWIEKYIHAKDQARVQAAIERAISSKKTFELEHQVLRADGSLGWTASRAIPMLDETGEVVEWFGAASDITERRKIEDDLRTTRDDMERSKRLYETITDNTPDLIYVFDLNYRFTYANKALLAMWGKSWEEAIGQGLRALGYEEWHATMHEREIDHIVATKETVRGTVTFPHAELGTRYYDYILTPVIGESGEVEAVAGTTRDVTDFKNAEAALSESEALFRNILEQTPEPMLVLKGEDMVVDVANEPLFRTWRTDKSVLGKPLLECLPEVKDQGIMEMLLDVYHNKKVIKGYDRPVVYDRGNGEMETLYYNFVHTPYVEADGRVTGVLVIGTDVTGSVLARQKLEESETRFRTLAETLPQMVWVTNADGSVQEFISGKWQEYFGDVTSTYAWEHMNHPEDRDRANAAFAQAIQTGEPFRAEVRLQSKSGEWRWHYTAGVPAKDSQGVVMKWVGSVIDIHDQKTQAEKLEQLVAERTTELLRSNEDLQQFAHVASHDLKEPIRKIITFANMLEGSDGMQLSERGRMSLERVRSAAERMMNMVNGVLGYSKFAAADPVWEPVDLDATIASVEMDLEVLIQQKGAVIEKGKLPALTGAPLLIHQLFYNLLNNALKFSKEGLPPHIAITGRAIAGGMAEITVRDNGIGFEPEYAEHIFMTFTRLHSKDHYEGTGLGLSLCKRIVERHGGTISAESKQGEGTAFIMTLPALG